MNSQEMKQISLNNRDMSKEHSCSILIFEKPPSQKKIQGPITETLVCNLEGHWATTPYGQYKLHN